MSGKASKSETQSAAPFHIRPAEVEDIPVLLKLIKKLAHYERLSHAVTATEEILHENLFGHRKAAEAILIEYQEVIAGFAVYFQNFSTFEGKPGIYIEDLYVDEGYRGLGLGRAMFRYIARLANERGCSRIDWSVLDWNESAIAFYERLGAIPLREWTTYRLTGEAFKNLG